LVDPVVDSDTLRIIDTLRRVRVLLEKLHHDEGLALVGRPEVRRDRLLQVERERGVFGGLGRGF
jgi:hypothetical protein